MFTANHKLLHSCKPFLERSSQAEEFFLLFLHLLYILQKRAKFHLLKFLKRSTSSFSLLSDLRLAVKAKTNCGFEESSQHVEYCAKLLILYFDRGAGALKSLYLELRLVQVASQPTKMSDGSVPQSMVAVDGNTFRQHKDYPV